MKESLMDAAFVKKQEEEKEKIKEENKAKVGDVISFKKDGKNVDGVVTSAKLENSVVVDMTIMDNFNELNMDYEKTVIGHGKYTIKERGSNHVDTTEDNQP